MANGNESNTQVNPAGTGDKIRDVQLDVTQSDGTIATVKMQMVAIADPNAPNSKLFIAPDGSILVGMDLSILDSIYEELQAIRSGLEEITGGSLNPDDTL